MKVTLVCKEVSAKLTPAMIYEEAIRRVSTLATVHPHFEQWWLMPSSADEADIPMSDREQIITRIEARCAYFDKQYPGTSSLANHSILLTNAPDEASWRERGSVALSIRPGMGELRLEINRLEQIYDSPCDVMWGLLKVLTSRPQATFAQTHVQQAKGGERRHYSSQLAVFQHRDFIGWMGYVNQPVSAQPIPDAARIERHGPGTLILATESIDLFDARSVEQVNRVEIAMAELGLLAVRGAGLGG
ncbi:hypothetical protein ACPEH1_10895 [Stenotrophomonas sp. NPDC077421]|uniref:hypothetical protein n=1 Tax=Stenotrophomonas sp. NPDC077421 TaxID=3414699 RepID=UPI003C2B56F8